MHMEDVLLYFAVVHQGDWTKIYHSIGEHDKVSEEDLVRIKSTIHVPYFTILSPDYPEDLKRIDRPPYVLFYLGPRDLIKNQFRLGMISSGRGTHYGQGLIDQAFPLIATHAFPLVVQDGKGLAHYILEKSILSKIPTIVILAEGFNPPLNKELTESNRLYLSEYPPTTPYNLERDNMRQRLIAGLSEALVIIECKVDSRAMTTVNYALNVGKEIFCFPFFAGYGSGCNLLIKQGATLVESINDVIENYPFLNPSTSPYQG